MIIPTKKLNNGFEIPIFGMGTWMMGGRTERDITSNDVKEVEAIRNAMNNGITHIDTAEMYANGHTEQILGDAIKGYKREALFLVSKVWKTHLSYDEVLRACERSLKRLGTSYLDLYLVHMSSDEYPLSQTIKAMNKLKEEKVIKNIGVCNFKKERLKKAMELSDSPIVLNQVHYNLIFREPETSGLLGFCQKNDVILCAWRPIEKGMLAGERDEALEIICSKYKKTPVQVVLNWLISQKSIVTLSKMSHKDHLIENLGSIGWKMEKEDIEYLRKEFKNQRDVSASVPLR